MSIVDFIPSIFLILVVLLIGAIFFLLFKLIISINKLKLSVDQVISLIEQYIKQ